jgi:Glycosyl hydrolases family 39
MAVTHEDRSTEMEVVVSRLRYGCCEVSNWDAFSRGPHKEAIWAQHRLIRSEVIRMHLFDRSTPDPFRDWPAVAGGIQAILNAGAVPMITFARSAPPFDSLHTRRWFANRCGEVVWHCIQQWGSEAVSRWYWSVWTKPNSQWDNPGMTFASYRAIYEEVAERIVKAFGSSIRAHKPLIGGPAIDGFQPFWFDWIWRFLDEIDHSLIGFVSWHRYGEWRARGEWRAATEAAPFASLVLSRAPEYSTMARAVERALRGKAILNVCGELNAHAHHDPNVSGGFNQGVFGAVYYAAALLQLIRGGADLELHWSGSDAAGSPFGLMDATGRPNHAFFAKVFFANLVRRGSTLRFAPPQITGRWLDAAEVEDADGNRAVILIHQGNGKAAVAVEDIGLSTPATGQLLKIETSAPGITSVPIDGPVEFDGYGVAVATDSTRAALLPCVAQGAGQPA